MHAALGYAWYEGFRFRPAHLSDSSFLQGEVMKQGCCSSATRILVVDDHLLSRRFTASALRQSGAIVKQASTASAALTMAREWRPQVILMDFRLGHEDGCEVARRIRADWPRTVAQPRIVMLTAESLDVDQIEALRRDVDDVLLKPVEPGALARAVSAKPLTARQVVSEPLLSKLQSLFRSELSACLPRLDGSIASGEMAAARAVLHQLIASSGMCGQQQLTRHLRALDDRCGKQPESSELALAYFAVLVSARSFLLLQTTANRN